MAEEWCVLCFVFCLFVYLFFFLCLIIVAKEVNRSLSGDDVIGSLVIIYSLLLSRPELEGVFFFWYRVTYIPSLFFVILIRDAPWWFFLFFFFFLSILNAIKNQMICYFFPITMFHMNTWWIKYCISLYVKLLICIFCVSFIWNVPLLNRKYQ